MCLSLLTPIEIINMRDFSDGRVDWHKYFLTNRQQLVKAGDLSPTPTGVLSPKNFLRVLSSSHFTSTVLHSIVSPLCRWFTNECKLMPLSCQRHLRRNHSNKHCHTLYRTLVRETQTKTNPKLRLLLLRTHACFPSSIFKPSLKVH